MHADEKTAWFALLAQEARRDLVFAWNVARGSFGGHKGEAPKELFMEAAQYLLDAGCKVGFGDPDSDAWRDEPDLAMPNDEKATLIAEMWESNRQKYEFLVFARRP
jgi:hypothetical protein